MLKVIINGVYYKDSHWYSHWNARQKKNCVFFYDYDEYTEYIINSLDLSQLNKLRLNIYNKYHKFIKFTKFGEKNAHGELFEGYKIDSPIIEIDNTEFALLLPSADIRKRYYVRDNIREKYFLKSKFINYIKLECPLM